MVTMKDITNMGRKIKRSNNPKTLARYQAQIDTWIAELAQDQARTQADILTLEEKIKMEEEARAHQGARTDLSDPKSPMLESKKIAVKIAEQMIPLEEKIKMEEEARAAISPGINQYTERSALPGIADQTKRVAHKIAEKAGPRKSYHYFEFERLHLRRSRL